MAGSAIHTWTPQEELIARSLRLAREGGRHQLPCWPRRMGALSPAATTRAASVSVFPTSRVEVQERQLAVERDVARNARLEAEQARVETDAAHTLVRDGLRHMTGGVVLIDKAGQRQVNQRGHDQAASSQP